MKLAFIDTETTGLDRDRCQPWEIAIITRDDDGDHEYCWLLRPDMSHAAPDGLRCGRYYQRAKMVLGGPDGYAYHSVYPTAEVWDDRPSTAPFVAAEIAQLLDDRAMVGAVPDFDAEILRRWLASHGQCLTAHYHLCDVETLAAGALGVPPPWRLDDMLSRYGLAYAKADRHTALGDARMVRDLYDAVLGVPGAGCLKPSRCEASEDVLGVPVAGCLPSVPRTAATVAAAEAADAAYADAPDDVGELEAAGRAQAVYARTLAELGYPPDAKIGFMPDRAETDGPTDV
jgi:DNA polymerase III epsilon subunit-like protein